MIKLIGKKIISGDMNLTRVSFPIKAMVPKTALENSTVSGCMLPYFMGKASSTKDPVERMKYVLTSITSSAYYMNMFLKPVIPFLLSSIRSSGRPCKARTQMEPRSIASKYPTILPLVSTFSWAPTTLTVIQATTHSRQMPASTQ